MLKRICFLFFVFGWMGGSYLFAQYSASVRATVDKNDYLIGEQFYLTLSASIPENQLMRFFVVDTLPHFEILVREKIDTSSRTNFTVLTQKLLLTSFDSGSHFIVPLMLGDDLKTDSIPIAIGFSPFDAAQPYHDIKDVREEVADLPEEKDSFPLWISIVATVIIVATLAYLLSNGKKKKVKPVIAIPAGEDAYQQLALLKTANVSVKQYYSELLAILKQYLVRKNNLSSLAITSQEWITVLKGWNLNAVDAEKLESLIVTADYVKFAKFLPEKQQQEQALQLVKRVVDYFEKEH